MIDVVELFAGVGGFRLGLEGYKKADSIFYSCMSNYSAEIEQANYFNTILSNQFEPGSKSQLASKVYRKRFGDIGHYNVDINNLSADDILYCQDKYGKKERPLMIVGGFPCQDYSVGTLLKNAKGLKGVKGVLWWEINRLLVELNNIGKVPKYLLFENVDRLLKSPVSSRGSDFATILFCLRKLGYTVEYQCINAAEIGFVQKRRRVFILAYFGSPRGLLRDAFNFSEVTPGKEFEIPDYKISKANIARLQKKFVGMKKSPFLNGGLMFDGKVLPFNAGISKGSEKLQFADVRVDEANEHIFPLLVQDQDLVQWKEVKDGKRFKRYKPDGSPYFWSEGSMELFQKDDEPLRTIITSEGGVSALRTRHLIKLEKPLYGCNYRILHPLELERANMFPDNFTQINGITTKKVGFLMGNALVIGIVEKVRKCILQYELNSYP